jgi:hypothetical protein
MSEGWTDLEWADKLDRIAAAIAATVYQHEIEMGKYDRFRKVTYDDRDYLVNLAKELRVREYRRLLAVAEEARE